MLDADVAWNRLSHALQRELNGDDKGYPGLYRALPGAQDLAAFKYQAGVIQGYLNVLNLMQHILQGMNAGDVQRPEINRQMN